MEEAVGKIWHRWVTRTALGNHPEAVVKLKEIERTAGVFFRALGGDPGLRVAAATEDEHGARRSLLKRIAGAGERAARARMDASTLRLPPEIDAFPERSLNRDLYLWLAALAAAHGSIEADGPDAADNDFRCNQFATCAALHMWPGIEPRYRRLVAAYLPTRPRPEKLPAAEAERERAIRQALEAPGTVRALPPVPAGTPPAQPVLLWLTGSLSGTAASRRNTGADPEQTADGGPPSFDENERHAHRAEQVDMPQEKNGLLIFFRAESLLAVAEFLRVNRPTDDEPDPNAASAARDLDHLSLAQDTDRVASKVRFDLDLPSAAEDDIVLGAGIPLPEWDYRKGVLLQDHVRLAELAARDAPPCPLPEPLRRTARRLHQQFAALQPGRRWLKGRSDGTELDLDAVVRAQTDRSVGRNPSDQLYLSLEKRERDLACMVLADLSLSTDSWVSSEARVIDVIRDALLLFGEALGATGDRFAMAGFSSVKRSQVRFHRLKDFNDRFDDRIRGRISAIKPGYYTRLGAALRHASQLLATEQAARRILLILSDGKPNDLDLYEGRYGIEDTRVAVGEARKQGLVPFCVTIDREGAGYLPHLFGPAGYAVIRKPEELPARLPLFYAQLTR
ncbi:nitric oxide reductase activation protein NorD [Aromatoleum aromaticum]|uniref:Predicted nitric oxide reductase activation protein n=1 Tax=Aromatoleum aromaticum (strain DSM 19018 / LMG 30748 / EbN1) TaxID=76114 RepID=Q5P8X8_AROAE|nr:VWA domain-containing protein [Aromatoleum aromaticum]NMG54926.1 VWA domain-containing protein [Aromatoleum aromaticum]CAI06231.1 predicted nitric oxide reductase activation protein [Aromatoleum aromaticum EbN1]